MTYCAFHNHSYFSVLDGFSSPKEYLERAKSIGLKGLQISEHGNEYSFVYYAELQKEYPDIRILYGMEAYECFDINIKDKDSKYFHLLLTCINEKSRVALNEIVTKSNIDGFYYKPRVDLNMLKPYGDLFIVSSACLASKIAREQDYQKCIEYVQGYKSIFPHFYLEIMSHNTPDQIEYNKKLIQLSKDTNTNFIITCDSHSATKEDLYYQSRLVQVARDEESLNEIYQDCYLQSEFEIHEILDSQIGKENVNIGLENTNKILNIIEEVKMPFQSPKLPYYPLPKGIDTNEEYLKKLAYQGWNNRKFNTLSNEDQKIRKERLEYELGIIHQMDYDGYFLIVWDFVNWSKNNSVKVGPGRGSAGGSIVCYLLGISELDPIKYDLYFERFLNSERASMPDIDLDFDDRDKVIQYITEKYGEDKVCQIINFSYITPLMAIKDTARIMGIPYLVADQISKKFIYETFDECVENNKDLLEKYSEYTDLFKIASKLSGRLRQASLHAGGVGIVNTKISDYMGMKLGAKNERVIQVDKKEAENIGIIKFDILGVSTLSVIGEILNDTKIDQWEIDPNNETFLSDEKMYNVLQKANTNGIFQVESQGMKDLLIRLSPENINDVSAVLALYRPDSMSFLEDYIYYKHHIDEIKVWHDDMKPIVKDTYGSIVYQEQLMGIVRQFGGRSMGGADLFRKAIGKKDLKAVKKESNKMYQEIVGNGYKKDLAKQISEYLSSKGGYMFCKAHSELYSVITLQTAYLKAHYPIYFFKALFNQNKGDYGTLNKYIIDAQKMNVQIVAPNINDSDRNFSVKNDKIIFGLEAIKGIGSKLVDTIIEEKTNNGKFLNLKDFATRTQPSISQIVALIKSGAIPCKNKYEYLLNYAESLIETKDYSPVKSLPSISILKEKFNITFDKSETLESKLSKYNSIRKVDYNKQQKEKKNKYLKEFIEKYLSDQDLWEFETLSIFLENNPFEKAYQYITPIEDCKENGKCVIIGVISDITKKKDRHGKQFAFVNVYSPFGLLDITVWHTQLNEFSNLIKKGNKIAVLCKKTDDNRLIAESFKTYEKWLQDRNIKK
jgi:DNA polymerase-3 subunit alpha